MFKEVGEYKRSEFEKIMKKINSNYICKNIIWTNKGRKKIFSLFYNLPPCLGKHVHLFELQAV